VGKENYENTAQMGGKGDERKKEKMTVSRKNYLANSGGRGVPPRLTEG